MNAIVVGRPPEEGYLVSNDPSGAAQLLPGTVTLSSVYAAYRSIAAVSDDQSYAVVNGFRDFGRPNVPNPF